MPPHRPTAAPRAVLYRRQSIARDDSVSLELQETAGRDYCTRVGYQVVDVVSDPGRSGTTLKRRQVLDLIDRVERREIDVIVVWRWSRLARSRRDFAVVCDKVESLGGRVESATETIDVRTAAGRFARGMMAEVAAWESEQRGEVWREVHARRRTNGLPAQGGDRFGYVRLDDGTYKPSAETGPVLADMYRRYLGGHGFVALAKWLNNEGVATLSGGVWARDRVASVLDSGFGAGQIRYGKRAGRTYQPGAHDPVISADEWRRYLVRRDGQPAAPRREAVYMLSGLLRCGDCGSPMHATRLGVAKGYGYWCAKWARSRQCRCVTVTRAKVEAAVFQFLRTVAGDVDDSAQRAAKAQRTRRVAKDEVRDLARRIETADKRLTKLTLGWTEGLVPDAAYQASRDELVATRSRLAQELVAAESTVVRVPQRPSVAPGIAAVWDRLPVASQRAILAPLVDRVVVHRPADGVRGGGRSRVWVELVTTWGESVALYRQT